MGPLSAAIPAGSLDGTRPTGAGRVLSGRVMMLTLAPILFDARVQKEAKTLRDAGFHVRIVSLGDAGSEQGLPNAIGAWDRYHAEMAGIDTRQVFLRSRAWRWLPEFLHKPLEAVELAVKFTAAVVGSRAEVVHCQDLLPGLFALVSKLLYRARLVYDAHELEVRSPPGLKRRVEAAYERLVMRYSDVAVTVNREIAEIMERAYGKPVHVIANRPPLVGAEQLDSSRLRESLGLPGSAKVVLYAGYVQAGDRGIEEMIRALAYLDEQYLFLIMGVGRLTEFREYVEGYRQEHGVAAERIRFIGPYPPEEVISYLSGADVSLALYQRRRTENNAINAPNKLFNSIMARTPVLASDNETLPKWVLYNGVGPVGEVVDESDPVAIAQAIRRMVIPERQREYRRNAEVVAQNISWEKEAEALLALYVATLAAERVSGGRPASSAV